MIRLTLWTCLFVTSCLASELPFCGFEMGSLPREGAFLNNANECSIRLAPQLRLFQHVSLRYTRPRNRLYQIQLGGIKEDIAYDSACEELEKVKRIVEDVTHVRLGEITFRPRVREASCAGSGDGLKIRLWINGQSNHGNGFWLKIESERVSEEEKIWAEANAKKFSIPL